MSGTQKDFTGNSNYLRNYLWESFLFSVKDLHQNLIMVFFLKERRGKKKVFGKGDCRRLSDDRTRR